MIRLSRVRRAVLLFFLVYLFVSFFLIEDIYGSVFETGFLLFDKFAGFSIMTVASLMLGSIVFFLKGSSILEMSAKKLIIQIFLVLLVAYGVAFIVRDNPVTEGSGLLELRAFLNFSVFVYLWSVCLRNAASISALINQFKILSLASCLVFLVFYLSPIDLFSVDNYGKSLMFESAIIYFWCFCFNLFFCQALLNHTKRLTSASVAFFLFACILLTLRRGFVVLLLVSVLAITFLFFFKKHKIKFIILSVTGVGLWYFVSNLFGTRYNFFALLDTSSESYEMALSSNIGHTLDVVLGFNQILAHPFAGLGPGVSFSSGSLNEDFIVSSMIHCQPLHFWLRLGILGFLFILVFYFKIWSMCIRAVSARILTPQLKYTAGAVFGFMAGHFVSSVFTPPFYAFEKQLLFFSLLFVLATALYKQSKSINPSGFL